MWLNKNNPLFSGLRWGGEGGRGGSEGSKSLEDGRTPLTPASYKHVKQHLKLFSDVSALIPVILPQ